MRCIYTLYALSCAIHLLFIQNRFPLFSLFSFIHIQIQNFLYFCICYIFWCWLPAIFFFWTIPKTGIFQNSANGNVYKKTYMLTICQLIYEVTEMNCLRLAERQQPYSVHWLAYFCFLSLSAISIRTIYFQSYKCVLCVKLLCNRISMLFSIEKKNIISVITWEQLMC